MLSIVRWLSRRSLGFLHSLGGPLGWVGYVLSPTYRSRLVANAHQAGIEPRDWRPAIAHAGRMVMELPTLWLRPATLSVSPLIEWSGAQLMDEAIAEGRGVVILTPHLGCFEVCAQAYAERWGAKAPVTVLYRPARKAWLREMMDGVRERPGLHTAPASLTGVRQMIRALRRGETVGLLPDQVPPEGMGVWAPFFGRAAYTMTLAARLIEQTKAVALLMVGERLPRGRGFHVHVLPWPEPLPTGEASDPEHQVACAGVVNRAMEQLIRRWPEQYLWGYHRYKNPRSAGSGA